MKEVEEKTRHLENIPIDTRDGVTCASKTLKDGLGVGFDSKVQRNLYSYILALKRNGSTETVISIEDTFTPTVGQYANLELGKDSSGYMDSIRSIVEDVWHLTALILYSLYHYDSSIPSAPFIDTVRVPLAKLVDPSDSTPRYTLPSGTSSNPGAINVISLCGSNLALCQRAMDGMVAQDVEASFGMA